jgi:hypothetical protein
MALPPRASARFCSIAFLLLSLAGGARIAWQGSHGNEPPIGALVLAIPGALALVLAGRFWSKSNRV